MFAGQRKWETESVLRRSSQASATPAADEERVYVYHARLGMMAFDAKTGETVWRRELPEPYFVFDWGPGMSPVIHGDRLFFCQDNDLAPAAYCLDKKTDEILWTDDRGDMACSYSHPVICETSQGPEVIIAGTGKMIGYDYQTGHRKWATEVFCRNIKTTPVTFDGIIYVSVESFGISYQWRVTADANGDGKIYVTSEPGVVSELESGPDQKCLPTTISEGRSQRPPLLSTDRFSSALAPSCTALPRRRSERLPRVRLPPSWRRRLLPGVITR